MVCAGVENLVQRTRAFLEIFEHRGLLRYLRSHWTVPDLIRVLESPNRDAVKVAATCLGLLAKRPAAAALIGILGHEDPAICSLAEHALWSIWYQECGPEAARWLRRASDRSYIEALRILDRLVAEHPAWAEAYNQRAIAHYKNHRFISAIDDCKEALAINEAHFGAQAGLGHAYAQLGLFSQAADQYRAALRIHPRMEGIRQSLRVVRHLARAR